MRLSTFGSVIFGVCLLGVSPWALAHKPLIVHTGEHDVGRVREAIKGGFRDIIEAPVTAERFDYMEFQIVPNGIITMQEMVTEIHLRESVKGLEIEARVFSEKVGAGGRVRTPVSEFSALHGIFMLIEGAGMELDYDVGGRFVPKDMGGFPSFNEMMKVLEDQLRGGMEATVSFADYPKVGRIYQRMTSSGGGALIQLVEDPSLPNYGHYLLIFQRDGASSSGDQDMLAGWAGRVRRLMGGNAPDLARLLAGEALHESNAGDFNIRYEKTGGDRALRVMEVPAVMQRKQQAIRSAPPRPPDFPLLPP